MIWDRVYPVFSVWTSLYFLFIFVELERYIKLETLRFSETRLHYSIARHLHNICLNELPLGDILSSIWLVADLVLVLSVNKRLASAFVDFLHGEPQLFFALLDRLDEDFTHRIFKLDLDNALKLFHGSDEFLWDLNVHILLLMMRHLVLPL